MPSFSTALRHVEAKLDTLVFEHTIRNLEIVRTADAQTIVIWNRQSVHWGLNMQACDELKLPQPEVQAMQTAWRCAARAERRQCLQWNVQRIGPLSSELALGRIRQHLEFDAMAIQEVAMSCSYEWLSHMEVRGSKICSNPIRPYDTCVISEDCFDLRSQFEPELSLSVVLGEMHKTSTMVSSPKWRDTRE